MYLSVIIIILFLLTLFVTQNIKQTIKNNQIYLNEKMIESVNNYFIQQYDSSKNMINSLYSRSSELNDTLNFLNYDSESYLKIRLDLYAASSSSSYSSINSYVRYCFSNNREIDNIIFYSYKNDSFTIFDASGHDKNIKKVIESMNNFVNDKNIGSYAINILENLNNPNKLPYYYTLNDIKDPNKLDTVGLFILRYKLSSLDSITQSYARGKNSIVVINKSGDVIYDSKGRYSNKHFPYLDKLKSTDKPVQLENSSYIGIATNEAGIITVGIIPVKDLYSGGQFPISAIYLLAIFLGIIAAIIIFYKIQELSKRIYSILKAMQKVKEGNLKARITIGKENDEISLISENFNDMCETLDNYIDKIYLSQIKQKNAEVTALQSKINPHFLYNTLESIRMKAIAEGDKEVGKMLYNLATLFRNMVKGKSLITIGEELDYCKLYLELFKFRYEGKFDYCIDVEAGLSNMEIVKLSLQPIIENYVVHGVRLESDDNFLLITVERDGDSIEIVIDDNGKGMEKNQVETLNARIKDIDVNGKSMGIINVHERIILTYGKEFGISVESKEKIGTKVTVRIPIKEINKDV